MRCHAMLAAAAAMAAAGAAGGCAAPQAVESKLVGRWQGVVFSRTTTQAPQRYEDYALTILPGGRFESVGVFPGADLSEAGRVVRAGELDGAAARVLWADYTVTSSCVAVEIVGLADPQGGPLVSGGTMSARLTDAGLLEFEFFGYAMSPSDPARSEAMSHRGVLRRLAPATQPDDAP